MSDQITFQDGAPLQGDTNPYPDIATEDEIQAALAAAGSPTGKPATAKAPKAAKVPKSTEPVDPGLCLCGCGAPKRTAKAKFIPGHDAKAKSQLLKVDRGQAKIEDVNPDLINYVQHNPEWAAMFPNTFAKADAAEVIAPATEGTPA